MTADAELRTLLQAGRWRDAAAALRLRLSEAPGDAQAWGLLALVQRNLRDAPGALAAARQATELDPALLPAWLERADAELASGELPSAHASLAQADALQPAGPTLVRLAQLLVLAGLPERALPRLRQAVAVRPGDAGLWRALYDAETSTGAPLELRAASSARMAELGGRAVDWMDHAHVCFSFDRFEQGHAALERALAADPGFLPARWGAFQLPLAPAPADAAAEQRFRDAWDAGVAAFTALDPEDPAVRRHAQGCIGQCTAFYRHYLDDAIEAQRRHGAMLGRLAQALGPRQRSRRQALRGGRRRIGIAHPYLREHTVDRLFGPLLATLDPQRFEVHVFALQQPHEAQVARHRRAGQEVHSDPLPPLAWADDIAALDLDVLLFTEVGMDPATQLLASLRLAPVQAMLWGHPVTSGLDTLDHALSPDALEPADADAHYSERLVRLPGLGHALQAPPVPPAPSRETGPALNLLCAQTVYKLLPAQDALFARVLAALPQARLHLVAHARPHVRDWLARRMRPTLARHGVAPERVLIHPFLPHQRYLQLAAACDLGLDSVGWSGGMSTMDLAATGLPVVSVEGPVMRQRQAAALARLLGADALATADADAYVARAVALGRDGDQRRALQDTLTAHAPTLYSGAPTVSAFLADWLATVQP